MKQLNEEARRILFEAITIGLATALLFLVCAGLGIWAFMHFGGGGR